MADGELLDPMRRDHRFEEICLWNVCVEKGVRCAEVTPPLAAAYFVRLALLRLCAQKRRREGLVERSGTLLMPVDVSSEKFLSPPCGFDCDVEV